MFGKTPYSLDKKEALFYRITSYLLYLFFLIIFIIGILATLFPFIRSTFDFNSPNAPKNTLFYPHLQNLDLVMNGKIPKGYTLTLFTHNPHVLESATIEIVPNDSQDEEVMLQNSDVFIRKGWAALFSPKSDEFIKNSGIVVVRYENNYFQLKDGTLFPFVSENAALSHGPIESIRNLSSSEYSQLQKSEEFAGFRVGTLLSFADGVFIVTKENTTRPFGSADILLTLGYSFEHVLPANAEEVGIYTRGKIILHGQIHPEGTLFKEEESGKIYIFQDNKLTPLDQPYRDFLTMNNDVIPFKESGLEERSSCELKKNFLKNSFSCMLPLNFSDSTGEDYQINLINETEDIDIQRISLGMQSSQDSLNARFVTKLLLERIFIRIGIY